MIKSLVILALLVLIVVGAALSRPSEESFQSWYRQQASAQQGGNVLQQVIGQGLAEMALKDYQYHNYILWSDETRNGQTAYVGAFSHWFSQSGAATTPGKNKKAAG